MMRLTSRLFLVVVALSFITACGNGGAAATKPPHTPAPTVAPEPTATPEPSPVPTTAPLRDVQYLPGRTLDVYLPADRNGPFPTVLLVHAAYLNKSDYAQMAERFAEGGYAVVPINWQVSKKVVDETFCALAWVHASAETYGFDLQRVALFGHVFGGYQAVALASADDPGKFLSDCPYQLPASAQVRGVVTYAGFFGTPQWALSAPYYRAGIATVYGISRAKVDELCETLIATPYQNWRDIDGLDDEASYFVRSIPLGWIDGSNPPIYVIHGQDDDTIDVLEAEAFMSELQTAGVKTQLQILPNVGHWTAGEPDSQGWESVLATIEEHLAELMR